MFLLKYLFTMVYENIKNLAFQHNTDLPIWFNYAWSAGQHMERIHRYY